MTQSIDWDYWLKLPEMRAFEAVALLHGTEPECAPPDDYDDSSPEYRKALRLLLACLSDRSLFTPGALNMGDPALHGVKLSEAAAAAIGWGWDIPEPLHAIAKAAAPVATPKEISTPAIASVQGDNTAPLALTTGDIAFCFAGLKWKTEKQWKKPLGYPPKWLADCIHTRGQQGGPETRWYPVLVGAALVDGKYASAKSVRARFQSQPRLSPWLEAWKTYEADNLNTE